MRLGGNASLFLLLKLWMQLQELPVVLPDAAQRTTRPHETHGIAFFFREVPVDVSGGMKTIRQGIQQQGRRNADVVALREAVHRDAHMHVSMLNGIIGKAQLLRAKDQSDGLVQRKRFGCEVVAMRTGGHNLIALLMKTIVGFGRVERITLVIIQVQPLGAAQHHIRIDIVMVVVFDDVDVLYAPKVAGTQHRAGIVRLEDILQNDRDMPSTVVENLFETLPSLVGNEGRQELKHGGIAGGIFLEFNILKLSSVVYYRLLHADCIKELFKTKLQYHLTRDTGLFTLTADPNPDHPTLGETGHGHGQWSWSNNSLASICKPNMLIYLL